MSTTKVNGKIEIQVSGNFMNNLNKEQSANIKTLSFDFSQHEDVYPWSKSVHLGLPKRIGFYFVKDNNDKVIYVGLANGQKGLFERHSKHEKKHLFELFNAKELLVFFCDDLAKDDPGKIAVLERYFIYTLEPVLNNDIKLSKSTNSFVIEMMTEKIDKMLSTRKLPTEIYDRIEELQQELIELKEAEILIREKYHELLKKVSFETVQLSEKEKHIGMHKKCDYYKEAHEKSRKDLEQFATEGNVIEINGAYMLWNK
ncbi:GIY-YIG nuclease family protein [Peribacillus huizhouensis]|uniref:Excinuclease UvrABC nuclease subunit n=1 Tax=Peribacillus huizhouensis TaxID=1501239 RepID=A0ABR6CRG1_9BACI|nr:GIY-YIG nuclease family protein [Peribacillus huizhouensis]MBA9027616.1 excinuclease UvrABC nuclease subunit [Peribacillus huizhouensis]